MKFDLRRYFATLLLTGCASSVVSVSIAEDELLEPGPPPLERLAPFEPPLESPRDQFFFVNQPPSQPIESPLTGAPSQPLDSPIAEEEGPIRFQSLREIEESLSATSAPGAAGVDQSAARVNPPTDIGQLLQSADSVQTVRAQRRAQVAFDPRVRAYHFGQIYAQADGEQFLPARLDLDSMLSKIDPSLIDSVTIIPGPYGLRYGPGFSFIDVITFDTPRSSCGFEAHNRFATGAFSNGGQLYARDTYLGGGEDYGFVLHYGIRSGADYLDGRGQRIPSSYNSQSVLAQLGFDVSEQSKVEFRYNRLDMRDTEYAFQFFDVDYSATDSFNVIYKSEDLATSTQTLAQAWYNQTRFKGDNQNAGKLEVRNRVTTALNDEFDTTIFTPDQFFGRVSGDVDNLGARYVRTYGEESWVLARLGADYRRIGQNTLEQYSFGQASTLLPDFSTNQPRSIMHDPGMFTEVTLPWLPFMRTTWGGRVDLVNTHPRDYTPSVQIPGITDAELTQNDVLWASYLTGDIELSPEWRIRAGGGYAERAPNLVDRYGAGVFIGMIQNGFTRVIGFPALQKEGAIQVDASLIADYGTVQGRATYFHSWINDYNTYASFAADPTGAQLLVAQNTSLATLNGFEASLQSQMGEYTTPFISIQYVEGFDREIGYALPSIYPLESRMGLRWQDPSVDSVWGLEWGFRFVARQTRVGYLRDNLVNAPTVVRVEQQTPGFFTSYLRGYYNWSERLHLVGGIDNLFDRQYIEHLDLRLPPTTNATFGPTAAFAPGFTAYAGLEWDI